MNRDGFPWQYPTLLLVDNAPQTGDRGPTCSAHPMLHLLPYSRPRCQGRAVLRSHIGFGSVPGARGKATETSAITGCAASSAYTPAIWPDTHKAPLAIPGTTLRARERPDDRILGTAAATGIAPAGQVSGARQHRSTAASSSTTLLPPAQERIRR